MPTDRRIHCQNSYYKAHYITEGERSPETSDFLILLQEKYYETEMTSSSLELALGLSQNKLCSSLSYQTCANPFFFKTALSS